MFSQSVLARLASRLPTTQSLFYIAPRLSPSCEFRGKSSQHFRPRGSASEDGGQCTGRRGGHFVQRRYYMNVMEAGHNPWPSSKNPVIYHDKKVKKAEMGKTVRPSRFAPMTEQWPGAPEPSESASSLAPSLEVSHLSNGITVASQEICGVAGACGVFVKAGSVLEDPETFGVSYMMEKLAYTDCKTKDGTPVVDFIANTGCNLATFGLRENFCFSADFLRHDLSEVVHVLKEAVRNPVFKDEDIEYQKTVIEADMQYYLGNPQYWMPEHFHTIAFEGCSLQYDGTNLTTMMGINSSHLYDFWKKHYHSGNLVVAGVGVNHKEFVEKIEEAFGDMSRSEPSTLPPQQYRGGKMVVLPAEAGSYAMLGLEGAGILDEDFYATCVLQALMGGGHSFSAGGPGKGMYTRLYTRVLNRNHWVQAALSLPFFASHSAFFAIYMGTPQDNAAAHLLELLAMQFASLLTDLETDEVERAKNMLIGSLLFSLESRMRLVDDIGRQIVHMGQRLSPREIIDSIHKISREDIQRVAAKMLQSDPSILVYAKQDSPVQELEDFREFFRHHVDEFKTRK